MKFIIDMNLSPLWVEVLQAEGWDAVHWSAIGAAHAPDHEIMTWAKTNDAIVFTHDLDFGAILATTQADAPSVIQIRTQDISPTTSKDSFVNVVVQYQEILEAGALIIIDAHKLRAKILPLQR
jgi:predicted nuclease of predicted toxin-antitoxin system